MAINERGEYVREEGQDRTASQTEQPTQNPNTQINERGEYVREEAQSRGANETEQPTQNEREQRRPRNWRGYFVLGVVAFLLVRGCNAVRDYISEPATTASAPIDIPPPPPPPAPPLRPEPSSSSTEETKDGAIGPAAPENSSPAPPPQTAYKVQFSNRCSQPVKLVASYVDSTGKTAAGILDFSPNESGYFADSHNVPIIAREFFYFAKMAKPERKVQWDGQFTRVVDGISYNMRRLEPASSNDTVISINLNCETFWQIKVKNSCDEPINVAFHYFSLEPGVGWTTEYWWSLSTDDVNTFTLKRGGVVEIASPPGEPGRFYYFARSKNRVWDARPDQRSKQVLVEGTKLNMTLKEVSPGDVGPHVNFTCLKPVARDSRDIPSPTPPPAPPALTSEEEALTRLRRKLVDNNVDQLVSVIQSASDRISISPRRNISQSDAEKIVQIVETEIRANPGLLIEVPCSIARQTGRTRQVLGC